jgi:hypothetical protein
MTILSFYVLALVQANLAINESLSLGTRSLAIPRFVTRRWEPRHSIHSNQE